jgi:catechol 2,3-dioxygenase-like lactoylglutathione lyase family enzyme
MSSTQVRRDGAGQTQNGGMIDLKLEAVVIPVADVDRAKRFYESLGWRLDADFPISAELRVVQFTPPGSGCSIQFGHGVTSAPPGSAQNLLLVVSDIDAARDELIAHGVDVSEVSHGNRFSSAGRESGPDPEHGSYRTFATFGDADGNGWVLQEVTTRLPGRVDPSTTTYTSAGDLEQALVRAATAHGEHEKREGGQRDEQWPVWYASYMVAEQAGTELPQ